MEDACAQTIGVKSHAPRKLLMKRLLASVGVLPGPAGRLRRIHRVNECVAIGDYPAGVRFFVQLTRNSTCQSH